MSSSTFETIYLDNAATTVLDEEVLMAMAPYWRITFGNPSSLYSLGREAKLALEKAREYVEGSLGGGAATLVFTGGGTESNNTAIATAVRHLGCAHILYSPIEHHSVLHAVERYGREN